MFRHIALIVVIIIVNLFRKELLYIIKYILKRLAYILLTLFIIVSMTFFLVKVLPGSPLNSPKLSTVQVELLESQYGLDESITVQYTKYISNVFTGNLGKSFKSDNEAVIDLISTKIGPSALIGAQSLLLGLFFGILVGVLGTLKQNSFWSSLITSVSVLSVSVPSFVLAALLQYFICTKWPNSPFPVTWGIPLNSNFRYIWTVLPSITLAFSVVAIVARFVKMELSEILKSDYILMAKVKGVKTFDLILKHSFRNILISLLTIVGPLTVDLLLGSLVVEKIFGIPGLGDLLISAISSNDLFVICGVTIFYSTMYLFVIFITDILFVLIDPRIRLYGGEVCE